MTQLYVVCEVVIFRWDSWGSEGRTHPQMRRTQSHLYGGELSGLKSSAWSLKGLVMQWGEGKASLDRVLDNNSGQIKTCLQVIIIIITITIIITINNDDAKPAGLQQTE